MPMVTKLPRVTSIICTSDEDIVFAGRALRGVLFLGGDLVLQFP